ncbi:hypothetical protein CRG98_017262 [Punica granatum]|uniref:Uncharacterized protein n=1 Tax=Punica granatum TaxID=22663 RepID=A0A2I0K3Q1_PUNGR|nr:hypothetical protein CRG98_017262 [Punica granatum]
MGQGASVKDDRKSLGPLWAGFKDVIPTPWSWKGLEGAGTAQHRAELKSGADREFCCTTRKSLREVPQIKAVTGCRQLEGPEARESLLLDSTDLSKVNYFCQPFVCLHSTPVVLTCFVVGAKKLTLRPPPQMVNWRRPEDLQSDFFECFLSVLGCPKPVVFFICQKRIPKDYLVDRVDPTIKSDSGFIGPVSGIVFGSSGQVPC